ncbi:uncharacterized protein RJT21DRAFT_136983 [Scheffersomyces amazonensis]|uniref:uncharacterized protein n=1 Tax=Scheffersomyces amazonensis TaxID=1078765 RepID=UPI00315C62DF
MLRSRSIVRAIGWTGKSYLHQSVRVNNATFYKMPAMSPTMSEGGIVSWKFKPGDSFNSGDVLLEVETDKATIDVEAVDDGKLWEILENDGAKGIAVGKPIAIIAEPEDDLSTLQKPKVEESVSTPPVSEPEPVSVPATPSPAPAASSAPVASSGVFTTANSSFKLSPAVELLLHEHNISAEEAYTKFQASGPKGRLLKGDVLAGLGLIPNESIIKITEFIKSKEHLDLKNIVKAEPKVAASEAAAPQATKEKPIAPKPTNILTVDLTSHLGEDVSKEKFKYAFEKSIDNAVRQTYAHRFPQYASSPIASTFESSDFFDDLVSPSVTKSRFEVYGISYEFFGNPSSVVSNDFDDLLGVVSSTSTTTTTTTTTTSSSSSSSSVNIQFKIKFDEKLSDSKQFVKYFEDSLLSQIPANKLIIS